jgi:mannose-6-phosphate isomerase-like protein (cupin superfamily)
VTGDRARRARLPPSSERHGAALLIVALLTLFLGARPVVANSRAQGTPELDTGGRTLLLQATVEQLPSAPVMLQLLRLSLAPGAVSAPHRHPGPEFGLVERGEITVRVDGPAVLLPADDEGTAIAPVGEDVRLTTGDRIAYSTRTPLTFRNDSDEPASLLAITMLPAGEDAPAGSEPVDFPLDGTPAAASDRGITSTLLGRATITAPPDGASGITLERFALTPGSRLTAYPGPALVTIEAGSISGSVVEGAVEIADTGFGAPRQATPDAPFTVSRGQALFFPRGMAATDDVGGAGEVTLLRLGLVPLGNRTAPGDGSFVTGATVTVTNDDVRLRSGPSTSASIVAGLAAGQTLTVTGEPVEADDITWVPVVDPENADRKGFVSAEFLQVAEE